MRAFENCLVCGASTENTHSARRGSDTLVCGGDCYKQASRNFKRGMSGYKVARLVDLLAQMGGPVTAAQLLARYRDTYGKSAMMGFNNTNAVTQKLMPIVNPETIRVDKSRKPFTFEYLGGTTIGDWLKPSMRAKYESVSFKAESFLSASNWSEYAPTERIIRRLKDSGVWELGDEPSAGGWDVIKWWATVKIKDGTLVRATEEELGDLTVINIILLDGQYEEGYGRVTVSYTDIDNAEWEDSYEDQMEQLGKELTIIFKNNGMFQSDDYLEYGDMGEFYNVHWGDLTTMTSNIIRHDCATNADLDIYEDDIIVMECNSCGRTATFRQETPYEGPRNAETFGAESDSYEWEWDRTDYAPTELIKKRLKEAGFKLKNEGLRYKDMIVEHYEPQLVAKNGNLLYVTLSQNEDFDGFSRLTFYDDNDENTTGKAPPMDWDILYEKGLLKGEDSVENPQSDYYQVYWCGLYDEWKNGHNCADNAKFDIYGNNFIVMECEVCGKTATFEQKTPYEGPRKRKDAETFEAEYGPSVEGMIDNPAGYYSYWQSFCEYLGVNDAHTAWRMVEKPWKWRTELEKWVDDSEWFSQEAESFEAEELKPEVSVGDRVRSYDFILPDGTLIRDDCYMEGRVTKIAPVDWCGSECDHYYILVDRVVRNGEEIDSKTFTDFWNPTQLRAQGQMVFPSVSESYIEVLNTTFNAESEAETDEYKGPFEVEIRRPNGAVATWKRYDNYGKLIEALEEIVSKRYTPYAIDVFATNVPYISGFTAMGPVTDYRKFHLATWKYGYWESGPWAKHFPTGLE